MKLPILFALLLAAGASAFSPASVSQSRAFVNSGTALSLFGGKKEGGGDKQPGMMDQLALFKKAQEVAAKKKELDDELSKLDNIGEAAEGKVTVTVKYVPPPGPMQPNPSFDVTKVDIDEAYLEETSAEDLSEALVVAVRDGETKATVTVAEKFKVLQDELVGMMGQGGAAPPAES